MIWRTDKGQLTFTYKTPLRPAMNSTGIRYLLAPSSCGCVCLPARPGIPERFVPGAALR